MKTQIKLLFFFALLMAGIRGQSQCLSSFTSYSNGPTVTFSFYDSLIWTGTTFSWSFGDGTFSNDSFSNFSHTYTASGTYSVCLTATNSSIPCSSTTCDTITINLCHGIAQFGATQTGFGAYNFSPNNIGGLVSPTLAWTFGDGGTSSATSPSHQFSASGPFQVCLTVTDIAAGCADTACNTMNFNLCSYANGFLYDSASAGGPDHNFFVYQPNAGSNYTWNFGDGSGTSGDTVEHSYTTSGTYQVCLITSDAITGCADSNCMSIYFDKCGINHASYLDIGSDGTSAWFDVGVWNQPNNVQYMWSFPGATPDTSSSSYPSTTYSSLGTYQACVALTLLGCSDTVCQSFTLSPPTYSISGYISEGGAASCANVYLIRQDTTGHLVLIDSISAVDSVWACTGLYTFNGLVADTYYVKAALASFDPEFANYLPTYYWNSLTWGGATQVIVSNYDVSGTDIDLTAGVNPGGPGFVAGWVSQGAGLVVHGAGNDEKSGQPLAGVQINLITAANGAVAYTYTDANGHYQFNNLAYGSYQIYAEELNKIPSPVPFTLSAQDPSDTSLDISINSRTATGIVDAGNLTGNGIYPNPVASILEVELSVSQSINTTLTLTNLLGETVLTQQTKLAGGANRIELNMENLAAGVYQLEILGGSKPITYKVVKINK